MTPRPDKLKLQHEPPKGLFREPRFSAAPQLLQGVMPIRYERDDDRNRAVIAINGRLDVSDLLSCLERHRAAGAWTYRLLYDVRHMTTPPSMENLRQFARSTRQGPGEPARGAVAILASDPVVYGRACTYAAMAAAGTAIEAFRDQDEAERWLADKP